MEAAGPLFYSFSDFELVLIAAFANQIANANIVLDGRRRICVVLVDGTSARSTIEFFVGMNHDVAMPVLRWGVRRILLLDEIVFLHFMALHYSLFSFAIISQIVVLNKKAVPHKISAEPSIVSRTGVLVLFLLTLQLFASK